MDRRSFVFGSAAAAAALKASFAQDAYPTRAITVINPFPPGGAVDVVMRPLAAVVEPMVQKPVVIETKSGAAGAVGARASSSAIARAENTLPNLGSRLSSASASPSGEAIPSSTSRSAWGR